MTRPRHPRGISRRLSPAPTHRTTLTNPPQTRPHATVSTARGTGTLGSTDQDVSVNDADRPVPTTASAPPRPECERDDTATTTSSSPLLYTPEQAAALLQVRPSWLRRKAAARAIPCRFIGKHLRFSHTDIETITDNSATPPQTSS